MGKSKFLDMSTHLPCIDGACDTVENQDPFGKKKNASIKHRFTKSNSHPLAIFLLTHQLCFLNKSIYQKEKFGRGLERRLSSEEYLFLQRT